jgi:putative addiction module component (TIGR02574 family)
MPQPYPDLHALSVAERIQLLEDVWESLAVQAPEAIGVSPEQRAELRRRVEAYEANPSAAIPWEQVRRKLRKAT